MKSFWNVKALFICAALTCGIAFASFLTLKRAQERELAEHAKLIRLQAERGDTAAETELGHLYYRALGVPLDYPQAVIWFRKAADKGDAKAQYSLGYMSWYGQGIPKDPTEAVQWYRKAADQGEGRAEDALGSSYYYGQGVQQDRSMAAGWYRKAADHGIADAQYDLGYMLSYGFGIAQDRAEANRLFRQAADQGNENARRTLNVPRVRINFWTKVIVPLSLLSSGLLIYGALLQERRDRNKRWKSTAMAGIFVLAYGALELFAQLYGGIRLSSSADATLLLARSMLGGVSVAMLLVCVLFRKSARASIAISCALSVAYDLSMFAAYGLWHRAPTIRIFLWGFGSFIGMALTSAILLWIEHRSSRDKQDDGVGLSATENPAGRGF